MLSLPEWSVVLFTRLTLGEGESFLSSFTREDETGKEEKTFTWEQLAKYNRRDNAHIAIRNKVVCAALWRQFVLK